MVDNAREILTEDEFLAELRGHIAKKYKYQINAAKAWGLSRSYVGGVVTGEKPPNKTILDDMGYTREKTAHYIKTEKGDDK